MPKILERFDRNVYEPGSRLSDLFIGITSMQTFERINKPVKKSVARTFRGKLRWRSILQDAIAFHQPDFLLPPSQLKSILRSVQDPEQHIRPVACAIASQPPRLLRLRNREITFFFYQPSLEKNSRRYCEICCLDFAKKTNMSNHQETNRHRENESKFERQQIVHNK